MNFCFGGTFCSQLEATARTLQFPDLGSRFRLALPTQCTGRTRNEQAQVMRDNRSYIVAASIQLYDKLNFSFLFSCPAASPIPQCQRCVCDSDDRNESKKI